MSASVEVRRHPFACYAQQRFEMAAEHVYNADGYTVFGDGGAEVMKVIKPSRRCGKGGVWFLNAETGNGFGETFRYRDYFPAEMLR